MNEDHYEVTATKIENVDTDASGDPRRARLLQAITETKKKLGGDIELWHLETTDHDILFIPPDEHQFAECTGKSAENRKRAPEAMKQLAYQIVKYPDLEVFRAIAKKRPGIPMKIANDAVAIAADEMTEFAKKV